MSWESRNGRGRYYTRTVRRGGRVLRRYIGGGKLGEMIALRDQIDSARAERPLTEGEALPALREIFAEYATAVRLARLAALAGLPGQLITGRQVAVLARVQDAAGAAALSASLARQQMTPAEVVATFPVSEGDGRAVIAAFGDLAGRGVMITAVPEAPDAAGGADADGGAAWVPRAARQARSPWVVPWRAGHEYGESYLLDLACARECSQADAVGPAGLTYGYVTSLEPALARREFFGSDGSSHGLRLFSLS